MASNRIEPGCLAVVVMGPCSGEACEVIAWVEKGAVFDTSNGPYTNSSFRAAWAVEFNDGCGLFPSAGLRRIDGGDPDAAQEESQDQEVPSHVSA